RDCLPQRLGIVGRYDSAGLRLPDQRGGCAVRRGGSEDRAAGGEVLVELGRGNVASPFSDVRKEQKQDLRVALEFERAASGRVWDEFKLVLEATRSCPLEIGAAEVACETCGDVRVYGAEGGKEWAWVSFAEETACVRDSQSLARAVGKAGELVEVGAV